MKRHRPWNAKLTHDAEADICALYATGEHTVRALAARYGVSPATISRAIRRDRTDTQKWAKTPNLRKLRFTAEQEEWITRSFLDRKPLVWIARELHADAAQVRYTLHRAGVGTSLRAVDQNTGYRKALRDIVNLATQRCDERGADEHARALRTEVLSCVQVLRTERKHAREARP